MKLCTKIKCFMIIFTLVIFSNVAFSQSTTTATTEAATSIGTDTATLNGTVNANGESTTVTFEYGLDTGYGSTWTADQSPVTGSINTAVSAQIYELSSGTTYHYRVVATNTNGTTYGDDMTFTTTVPAPAAVTISATSITVNSAMLNGFINTYGAETTVTFEYGEDTNYGTTVDAAITPIPAITPSLADYVIITGLTESTTYHYRVVATNTNGNAFGDDMTFTTNGLAPNATTNNASSVTNNSAVLNGLINANNSSTTVTFEYGLTTAYGSNATANQSPVTGTSDTSVNVSLSGLSSDTLYHYRVVGDSTSGTTNGEDKMFYTGPISTGSTVLTTLDATNINANSATLNGNVYSTNFALYFGFEIGLDTSYGGLKGGTPSIIYTNIYNNFITANMDLLEPNTTYHYRLIANQLDSNGTVIDTLYGDDMTFTTPDGPPIPTPPTAVTNYASSITTSSATLNGTVNAKNDSTTVTFQYGLNTSYGTTVTANESPLTGATDTEVTYNLSSLANGTTYHYRVVAQNGEATTNGEDKTFTTGITAPTVSTSAATSVGTTTATLNGSVNSNNGSTTVTFEYGLTSSFGRTVTANQSPVTGTSNTAINVAVTGLTPNTTYYFRAVGENTSGKTNGSTLSFKTIAAPTVTTDAATLVNATSATLNGTTNANGFSSTVTFEYGTTTAYGTTVTADQSPVTGTTGTAVSKAITGLTGATTYHYRVVATNANGTSYGSDMTFYTSNPAAPTATTDTATFVFSNGATLRGTVNANNSSTTVTFEYGTTVAYGTTVTADQSPISGGVNTEVSKVITGLSNNTTYHYRVVGVNGQGTTNGADMTFATSYLPTAITNTATNVGVAIATLNGTGNGNIAGGTYTFEYGLTASYGTSVSANPSYLTDNVTYSLSQNITGLTPNTTYHYRLKGQNIFGTNYGDDMTFTTSLALSAITDAATSVTSTSAILNGTVNANTLSVTVYFEFGEDTSYGRQANATPYNVSGSTDTSVLASVALAPNNTYHFRVVIDTGTELIYGDDMTFSTSAPAPNATTESASSITTTSATLNGSVNANNDSTTVTFEYGTSIAYGTTVTADQSPVTGTSNTAVSKNITGLTSGTTYHYRVVAQNGTGITYGDDMTFTAGLILPTATTNSATNVSILGATLNGTVNANNTNTTVTFEYGLTTGYGATVTADQSPVTGTSNTAVSAVLNGLVGNNTYHYRVVATNVFGTANGLDSTFTTVNYYTISGTVTDGSNPISGVTITFSHNGHTETTAPNGTYSYVVPYSTSTTISANHPGYSGFTPIVLSNVVSDTPNQNFTGTANQYSISGTVTEGTVPIQGATILFSHNGHTETTAADGTYSYSVPYNTTTTITATHPNYSSFTPVNRLVSHISTNVMNQNFSGNLQSFQITITSGIGGGTNPSGTVNVAYGDDLTIVFSPDDGYHNGDVTVDGENLGVKAAYSFRNITGNHTIYAEFVQSIPPVITSFTADQTVGNAQFPVTFEVDAYDPDGGNIVEYQLVVEGVVDNVVSTTNTTINYNFLFAGQYFVTVVAIDDEGESTTSDTIEINVNSPATITLPKSEVFNFDTWLINPFSESANITLTAVDENGEIVETVTGEVGGFNKMLLELGQFKGLVYKDLKIFSDKYVLLYTETSNNNAKMLSLVKTPLKNSLIVPHIAEEVESWDTFTFISKNKTSKLNVEVGENTTVHESGESSYLLNMEDYLTTPIDELKNWGYLTSSYIHPFGVINNLTGFELFVKSNSDGASVELISKTSNVLYIPHIPTEVDTFWTGFAFVNNTDSSANVDFNFYASTGEFVGTVSKTIDANSKLKGTMDSLFPDQNGLASWAIAESNKKICGVELYGTFNAGICGFSLSGQTFSTGILPVVDSSELTWTGLALTNPNSEMAVATLQLISSEGNVKATTTIEINANNRYAITLKDLFEGKEFSGSDYIKFTSTKPLTAVEALGDIDFSYMMAIPSEYINY